MLNLVTTALIQLPIDLSATRGICDVRLYGGWYEGVDMSQLAQKLTVSIQNEFPTIIRLPRDRRIVSLTTNAELAFALLEEPTHHLFHTYRKKGRPGNIRVQSPATIGCLDTSCPLPLVKKILGTGRCPTHTCIGVGDDLVYRNEQKIVDTMLTCDLIYATNLNYDCVVIISGDDDFLPPIRTALLRGTTVARIHPKASSQRASFPAAGARFIEMEL